MKLIDKDAVLAEIERRIKRFREEKDSVSIVKTNTYKGILSFLNTLEVKEVDLQSEIDRVWDKNSDNFSEDGWKEFEDIAKHFFELGLKASNPLTWEDISDIDDLLEESLPSSFGDELELKGYYEEVLKRFKAQKGEL